MTALDIKWNFQDDYVVINKTKVPLVPGGRNKELFSIEEKEDIPTNNLPLPDLSQLKQDKAIPLFPYESIEIPANSSKQITLKERIHQKEKVKSDRDYVILPKKKTMSNKGLVPTPISLCNKNLFMIELMNPYSSSVKINRNDLIAYAFRCSSEMQNYLEHVLINNVERKIKQSKDERNEEVSNVLQSAKDELMPNEQIQEMNSRKKKRSQLHNTPTTDEQNEFDKRHFNCTLEEKGSTFQKIFTSMKMSYYLQRKSKK